MATSLISTIGSATANSYVSVASADEYFELREEATAWLDLSTNSTGTLSATQRKSNLLIQATREIDNTYRFVGSRDGNDLQGSTDYQRLEFPRSNNTDSDGNLIIPDEIKYGTYEQALWTLQRNANLPVADIGEETVRFPKFSNQAYDYIKPWVNRSIRKKGRYSWQGSMY